MNELFDLTGKIALITGGTHGIGLAIGKLLARAGARVCVNDINEEKLSLCTEAYNNDGLEVFVLNFDVTSEEDTDKGITLIEKETGQVDILVNNAGIIKRIPILDMSVESFRQVLDVDLVAPLIVSKR